MDLQTSTDISVIVPVGPREAPSKVERLISRLVSLGFKGEVIISLHREFEESELKAELLRDSRVVSEGTSRASQMNVAARVASKSFLWFLHLDTDIDADCLNALYRYIDLYPDCLGYFDLKFDAPGFSPMRLTEIGVAFRCECLGLPFGDQAFIVHQEVFSALGAYDETAPYGEDHLLVWKAYQEGVPVQRTGISITTSARKYETRGWLNTTKQHVWLTWKQGYPQRKIYLEKIRER